MSAEETLASLLAELRSVRRQARTWRPGRASILEPTTEVKHVTVLIYWLCQDARLAAVWAQRQQDARRRHDGLWPATVTPLHVGAWFQEYGDDPQVTTAMSSFSNRNRLKADVFLMESLVAEEIEEQNRKGLAMCPRMMMESYLRKWRARPRAETTEQWLVALQEDINLQNNWRKGFKRRWNLQWSNLPDAKCLGTKEIVSRTVAYLKWIRWVLQVIVNTKRHVVINMDETMMANVNDRKKGVVVDSQRKRSLDYGNNAKRRACPRCSLLACISTDNELQKHLPQIFLPKGRNDKKPPEAVRQVFTHAGAPVEGWHGTSGFLCVAGAMCFLTRLRGHVRRHRPDAQLVLIWDASIAHTNPRVLRHARKLDIVIVLVPGRLTWLLQPLDVYVFVCLKRRARYTLLRERIRHVQANLSIPQQLQCCTEAVRTVLVDQTWGSIMRKCGVSADGQDLSQKLAAVVHGCDLTPEPPSQAQLQSFIGCSAERASLVRGLLVEHLVTPCMDKPSPGDNFQLQAEAVPESHGMGMLVPVLEPVASKVHEERRALGTPQLLLEKKIPRARRLTPCPRNLMLLPLPSARRGVGAATRSQRPQLVRGIVETETQSKADKARSSHE